MAGGCGWLGADGWVGRRCAVAGDCVRPKVRAHRYPRPLPPPPPRPGTQTLGPVTVHTPALAAAALTIDLSAGSVSSANSAAASAAAQSGAFGGEPIGAAYDAMCSRAQAATSELESTIRSLSRNVAAAAVGYLVTDRGVVPTRAMPGFI